MKTIMRVLRPVRLTRECKHHYEWGKGPCGCGQ